MRLRIIILSLGIGLGLGAKWVETWITSSQPAIEVPRPIEAENVGDQMTSAPANQMTVTE